MYDITFCGLNQWNKSLFEKLGWMVLAYNHGHYDVTDSYIVNIKNLHKAILEKMKDVEDKDKKKDLIIMERNVKILLKHCDKDFNKKLQKKIVKEKKYTK